EDSRREYRQSAAARHRWTRPRALHATALGVVRNSRRLRTRDAPNRIVARSSVAAVRTTREGAFRVRLSRLQNGEGNGAWTLARRSARRSPAAGRRGVEKRTLQLARFQTARRNRRGAHGRRRARLWRPGIR